MKSVLDLQGTNGGNEILEGLAAYCQRIDDSGH
jgi:hypothetical protein